ncbi:MAG: hypothetical protein A2857_04075 [Candidatus Levybacteria bacterium RIFCSPHIGHO2_01_FULL_36_15]|nr:MAG: hypothetical protein A2857_04075 [Candidatus Levybacteria bacterium RIFCSPHIGHO2_01_FULL_36_15]OGH37439.1 MAG: hypothetical protein A2905_04880 [Candidatus Levybacteria bacterium RIFCSPLOWO2_01_FULL_36_10]
MPELINGLSKISLLRHFANFHGALGMFSLIFLGAGIVLYFFTTKIKLAVNWLRLILLGLFINLSLLDIAGLSIYTAYRAENGPRTILKASKETAWLHTIVFEHKEFLAFAPPVLIFTALFIVLKTGDSFGDKQKLNYLRLAVISCLILSLLFVLIVASEAVLVTKVAPI